MNICGAEFDPDELEKEMDGDDGMHNPNLCGVNETDADTDQFTTDDDEDDSDTPLAGGPLAVLESAVRKSVKSDSLGNSFATNRPSTKRPKSPKATLQTAASYSGRTYQESPPAGFEGSMSSPTLLNAMSGSEWLTKSYTAPDLHCPSMDSQSSFDRLVNHLETGFRVRLFEEGSSKRSQTFTLFLDVAHNKLCLKRTSEEKADRKVIHEIPLGKILRFETGGASTEVFPSKSFTIVVNQEASIRYFDIKAESSIDREIILSSLTVFLEDYKVKKGKELTEIIDVDEYKEGGTSEQPILCTLSLEQQDSTEEQSESYLTPGHHSQNFKKSQSECDGSLVIHLEDVLSNQESFSLTTIDEDRVDADTPRSSRNATVGRSRSPTGFSKIRGKFTQPVSPYSHTAGRRSPPANHSSPPRPEHRGARSDAVLPPLAEDTILELAASGQLTSNWCAEEMCSFALKDITETCTGIFEPKNSEVGCINPASLDVQQRTLEEYIASALGAPSAFYSYWTEKVRPNSAELKTDEKVRAVPNGRVRNRASVLNAQAARLNKLKGEMTFASALKKSKKMNNVQTVKSFDDSNIICSKRVRATNKAADKFHSSALLNQVVGSMLMGGADTSIGEVAYYDSDPEDVRARTLRTRGPRQVEAELKQAKSTEGDKANPIVLFTGFETVKSTKRVSKKLDEDSIVQMVQTMMNQRMTLIWHPTQKTRRSNRSPLCARVWIEAGVCLVDGSFVLPKLCWTKVADTDDSRGLSAGRILSREVLHKIDLLDICRVHVTKTIDRERHPFAEARKSFFVETQADTVLFEALTEIERDRIVYGLKLSIARLASLLMLRDIRAADEFFGANSMVPGEAPAWVSGTGVLGTQLPAMNE